MILDLRCVTPPITWRKVETASPHSLTSSSGERHRAFSTFRCFYPLSSVHPRALPIHHRCQHHHYYYYSSFWRRTPHSLAPLPPRAKFHALRSKRSTWSSQGRAQRASTKLMSRSPPLWSAPPSLAPVPPWEER